MRVVVDIETERLDTPSTIWVIVARDIDTGVVTIFENPLKDKEKFLEFSRKVDLWVGHNFLGFDGPVLNDLFNCTVVDFSRVVDTLVVSRLLDYARKEGHSLEAYGLTYGIPKVKGIDFTVFSKTIVDRCIVDTSINLKLYKDQEKYINSNKWKKSITLEQNMVLICNRLKANGFYFDKEKATILLSSIKDKLDILDGGIKKAFPPVTKLLREVHPNVTKFGTLNRKDFRFLDGGDLTDFNGGPFSRLQWVEFNAGSPKQVVEVLNKAGWKPYEKTKGHIEFEREARHTKVDLSTSIEYAKYREYGWKINENNLSTLPSEAPKPAKLLAQRILLESRRKTLTEWIDLTTVGDSRIHGTFHHIGAWTHRMSHTNPNTANIPREDKLYGGEMRSLWGASPSSYLVGVDAEGIQLRVLAHYINDPEFTNSVVYGSKEKGTDPHTLNQLALGSVCKTRDNAKTFIYAWLLGAGVGKIASILGCSIKEALSAIERFLRRYSGLQKLKNETIPRDASRGYFEGFDGRYVKIYGEEEGLRSHLALSGYLQCGEAIIMKAACVKWHKELTDGNIPFKIVNFVHDEWQTETTTKAYAEEIASRQINSLVSVGVALGLRCPLSGTSKIGTNWLQTH